MSGGAKEKPLILLLSFILLSTAKIACQKGFLVSFMLYLWFLNESNDLKYIITPFYN